MQHPVTSPTSEVVVRRPERHQATSLTGNLLRVALVTLILAFATWLVLPAWYVALVGTSAQGRVTSLEACGEPESNLAKATIQFQDRSGTLHLASTPRCGSYTSGEMLSLRYLPADPGTIVTVPELGNLLAMTGLIAGFDLVFLAVLLQPGWQHLRARTSRTSAKRTRQEAQL